MNKNKVEASSAMVRENGSTSSLSSIKVGDTVMIGGKVTTASTTATQIDDGLPSAPANGFGSTSSSRTSSTTSTQ